jgi:polynucleotide 5'-hydroxyl-kinase GRC3/NOL9
MAGSRRPALLDADLGQKIVGPPGCVTLGLPRPEGRLALESLTFVGTTDPVRGWTRVAEGIVQLASESEGRSDLLVMNTGGFLSGAGARLKAAKIAALRPDLLIAIGSDTALDALIEAHLALPCLRLPSSPAARRKTAGERRRARASAFRDYFADAEERNAEWAFMADSDGLCARPGLVVGVADESGRDQGLGMAVAVDANGRNMRLLTPVPQERAALLRPGELLLRSDYREIRAADLGQNGPMLTPHAPADD